MYFFILNLLEILKYIFFIFLGQFQIHILILNLKKQVPLMIFYKYLFNFLMQIIEKKKNKSHKCLKIINFNM